MKNILHIIAVLFLASGLAPAQTPEKLVQEIQVAAADACVTASYSLNARIDDAMIKDEGVVVAQDDVWMLKGRTIEIYTCTDGTWILNPESREVMIEPKWTYDDLEAFYRTLSSASANDMHVRILSKTLTEKKPVSSFVPEIGSDWIVTDLR